MQQAQRVIAHELVCAEPAQVLKQIRDVIILFASEYHFSSVVNNFLNPRKVFLRAVAIHRDTVTDLRENKGLNQSGDDGWRQVVPEM